MARDADDHPLAVWREEQGLSQADLGERLGVSQAAVSRWEWGVNIPRRKDLRRIHRLTGIVPDEFYDFVD